MRKSHFGCKIASVTLIFLFVVILLISFGLYQKSKVNIPENSDNNYTEEKSNNEFTLLEREYLSDPITFYKEEKYLEHRYGEEFKNFILSSPIPNNCEILNFYFRDNYKYDSEMFGEISDMMAVDIQIDIRTLNAIKNGYWGKAYKFYDFSGSDSYILFYPEKIAGNKYLTLYALNEEKQIFRGIIITDTDFEYTTDITGYLLRWCTLDF